MYETRKCDLDLGLIVPNAESSNFVIPNQNVLKYQVHRQRHIYTQTETQEYSIPMMMISQHFVEQQERSEPNPRMLRVKRDGWLAPGTDRTVVEVEMLVDSRSDVTSLFCYTCILSLESFIGLPIIAFFVFSEIGNITNI